jgi:hypothetical protein
MLPVASPYCESKAPASAADSDSDGTQSFVEKKWEGATLVTSATLLRRLVCFQMRREDQ